MYEHSNSYRNGVELERGGVNPTLTIKPTAQTKVVLSGEYFYDRRVADRGIPSFGTMRRSREFRPSCRYPLVDIFW